MSNINRITLNIDKNTHKVLNDCVKKYKEFNYGAKTPIPNQCFGTALTSSNEPSTLYFSEQAHAAINYLKELSHRYSVKNPNQPLPINYVCKGYKDHNGDIVIDYIFCPLLTEAMPTKGLGMNEVCEYILEHKKEISFPELQKLCYSQYIEYLSSDQSSIDHLGTDAVALFGYTKYPTTKNEPTSNCFTLGEIANSIFPGDIQIDHKISSGLISITPKTMEYPYKPGSDTLLSDGSLECMLVEYSYNESYHRVCPRTFLNITKCLGKNYYFKEKSLQEIQDFTRIKISNSRQPIEGITQSPDINVSEDEYTM